VGDVPLSGGSSPHRVGQLCGDHAAMSAGCAASLVGLATGGAGPWSLRKVTPGPSHLVTSLEVGGLPLVVSRPAPLSSIRGAPALGGDACTVRSVAAAR